MEAAAARIFGEAIRPHGGKGNGVTGASFSRDQASRDSSAGPSNYHRRNQLPDGMTFTPRRKYSQPYLGHLKQTQGQNDLRQRVVIGQAQERFHQKTGGQNAEASGKEKDENEDENKEDTDEDDPEQQARSREEEVYKKWEEHPYTYTVRYAIKIK